METNRVAHAALCLCIAGLAACGGGDRPPRPTTDAAVDGGDSGADGAVPCASDAECDDGVDCTNDSCSSATHECSHVPVPALCPAGSSCNPEIGCEVGMACGSDEDCQDDDACTMNERCDPASRTCTREPLDGDGDGDPPRVCGGTDCDDSDPNVNASAREVCGNGVDDDCDGMVDEVSSDVQCQHERFCGHLAECDPFITRFADCADDPRVAALPCSNSADVAAAIGACADALDCDPSCEAAAIEGSCTCTSGGAGAIACTDGFSGAYTCVDAMTDVGHCGSCDNDCGVISIGSAPWSCVAGTCTCAAPGTQCGSACVDTHTDRNHCGDCDTVCPTGAFCSGGSCRVSCAEFTCPGGTSCGTSSNPLACGPSCLSCTAPAHGTAVCSAGSCDFTCNAGYVRSGSECVSASCASIGHGCVSSAGCSAGGCLSEVNTTIGDVSDPISGLTGSISVPVTYWNGGYCSPNINDSGTVSRDCDVSNPADPLCGDCGRCTDFGGGLGLCMANCTPNITDNDVCRDGYECHLTLDSCIPGCSGDAECKVSREESNGIPGIQTPRDCRGDSSRPAASQVCGGVNSNFDHLVYDASSGAACNPSTNRCTNPGTAGATAGIPCTDDAQCEAEGLCLTTDWPGGSCTKLRCDLAGNACAAGGVCQDRRIGVSICVQGCTVAAGATTTNQAAWLTNTGGCRAGYACTWNGTGAAGAANNGGCLPGNFNAVSSNNIGSACTGDADCWSPFGQGSCFFASSGFPGGYCTVTECAVPGVPANVCGPSATCVDIDGPRGDETACLHNCSAATDCRAGYACVDADGDPATTGSVCTPGCTADAECRPTERCSIPAGSTAGTCVAR